MNKKIYVICILAFCGRSYNIDVSPAQQSLESVALFGPDGMNLGPEALDIATTVLTRLEQSSAHQRVQALDIVLQALHAREAEITQEEERLKTVEGPIARELYHSLFITRERIKHLEQIQKELGQQSYITMLYEKVENAFNAWWYNTDYAQQLADALLAFYAMEEQLILDDYQATTKYVVMLPQYHLPPLLAHWHTGDVRQTLLIRASRLGTARVQMGAVKGFASGTVKSGKGILVNLLGPEALGNLYVQNVAFMAGSMSLQMSDQKSAEALIALQKKKEDLQKTLNDYFVKLGTDQKTTFSALYNGFIEKQKGLAKEFEQEGVLLGKELTYVNKSVAEFALSASFLTPDLIMLDRMFEASPMQTPARVAWYNPFYQSVYKQDKDTGQVQFGDWQYVQETNNFWQQGLIPITDKTAEEKQDPSLNSIFTEYVPAANGPSVEAYDIEIACTLIQTTYPFFAGIMFNKSRWISGNPECLSQYRLIGLYGTESKPGDATTRSINLCFAQQKLYISSDPNKKSSITAPLEQIISDPKTVLYSFKENEATQNDTVSLIRNPQTYIIHIKTSADVVTWRLLKDTTVVKEGTINNLKYQLNPDIPQEEQTQYSLFNYHGIGFMAPGCQAAFTLTQPTTLVYTQQDRDSFNSRKGA
jgi:hypothetical protein